MKPSIVLFAVCTAVALSAGCKVTSHVAGCIGAAPAVFRPVYPIQGATAVPDAPGVVVFAVNYPLNELSLNDLQLVPPTGPPVQGGMPEPVPSPIPTPNQSWYPPWTTLVAYPVPALSPGTIYQSIPQGSILKQFQSCGNGQFQGGGEFVTQ